MSLSAGFNSYTCIQTADYKYIFIFRHTRTERCAQEFRETDDFSAKTAREREGEKKERESEEREKRDKLKLKRTAENGEIREKFSLF